jgi:hypothetical protein
MPLSDFAKNWVGGDFDFVHLKDFTVINIQCGDRGACTTPLQLSNLVIKGNCPATTPGRNTGSNTGSTGSTGSTVTKPASSGAWMEYPALAFISILGLF